MFGWEGVPTGVRACVRFCSSKSKELLAKRNSWGFSLLYVPHLRSFRLRPISFSPPKAEEAYAVSAEVEPAGGRCTERRAHQETPGERQRAEQAGLRVDPITTPAGPVRLLVVKQQDKGGLFGLWNPLSL